MGNPCAALRHIKEAQNIMPKSLFRAWFVIGVYGEYFVDLGLVCGTNPGGVKTGNS